MKSYHRDEKRVKTKERTKSVNSYNLMRQEELERQCEEFFISLDNEAMKIMETVMSKDCGVVQMMSVGVHKEEVKEVEKVVMCLDDEMVKQEELKPDMKEEKSKTLKDSIPIGRRGESAGLGELSCTYENCLEEFHNKEVGEPLKLELGQPLRLFGKDKMLGSNKEQQDNGSYFSSGPEIPNLLLCYSYCGLENSLVKGINHHSFNPHFHYYMLLWLMISLEHLNMVTHCFEWSGRVVYLRYYELPSFGKLCYDEYLRGIKSDFTELYGFIMNMSIFEIFVLIITKWKLFNDGEINQVPPCCPDFELMGLRYKFGVDHCETCLRMYFLISLSSTSSSHDSRGVVSHPRVVFDEKGAPKQQGQTHCIHMWVNVEPIEVLLREFLVRTCCFSLAVLEHHDLSKDGNQSIIMTFDPGDKEEQSQYHSNLCHNEDQYSGLADAVVIRTRHFVLIFDPGGRDKLSSSDVKVKGVQWGISRILMFSIKGWAATTWCGDWNFFSYFSNLRSNSLNLGRLQQELGYGSLICCIKQHHIDKHKQGTYHDTFPIAYKHPNEHSSTISEQMTCCLLCISSYTSPFPKKLL